MERCVYRLYFLCVILIFSSATAQEVIDLPFTKDTTSGDNPIWMLTNYSIEMDRKRKSENTTLKPYIASFHKDVEKVGFAETVFKGKEGFYKILIDVVDENDGTSTFGLLVDGETKHEWMADGIFAEFINQAEVRHVKLKNGSKIKLWGKNQATEYARIQRVKIIPDSAPPLEYTQALKLYEKEYSKNLVYLGDYFSYANHANMIPVPSATWKGVYGGRKIQDFPTYVFKAKAGDTLQIQITNTDKKDASFEYQLSSFSEESKKPTGKVSILAKESNDIDIYIEKSGLYKFRARGNISSSSHRLSRIRPITGGGSVFFFVPKECNGFVIHASAQGDRNTIVTVKNSDSKIVWYGQIPSGQKKEIRVEKSQAGKPWFIDYSSIRPRVRIEGVPPYQSVNPSDLLVPAELLEKKESEVSRNSEIVENPKNIDKAAIQTGEEKFSIVSNGKINCEIQIPENTDKTIRNSALTLGHFIKKISGVSPKLVQGFDDSKNAIQLGMKRDFKGLSIPDSLESLSDEAFYVKTFKNKTIICGKSPVAVRHGVYTLLRKLGCRWYFPGSDWEILPRSANIDIALNVIDSPSYDISRHIVYGMFSPGNFNSEFRKWYEANRLGSAMGGAIKHSYSSFVPYSLYDKHPEYFSMKDTDKDGKGDKRVKVQPCTTHPEVIKMFINGAKKGSG